MTVQIYMAVRHRVGIQKLSCEVIVDSQQGGGGGRGKQTSHIFPQAKIKWEQRHLQAPEQNRCQLLLRTWNTSQHFLTNRIVRYHSTESSSCPSEITLFWSHK